MILIQAGTIKRPDLGPDRYEYRYTTEAEGSIRFLFDSATVPKIGDSIDEDTYVLIPLEGYLINQDHSKWIPQQEETWGRNK